MPNIHLPAPNERFMMNSTELLPPTIEERSRRRVLPKSLGYAVAAYVIGLGLFAAVTPSPLYGRYSELWHFGPLVLTLIYATYAMGVLMALLFAGRVSDEIGRRPVLLSALTLLMLSTVLFIFAASPAWLFAARGLQGLATGAAISAAGAALLDLHPRRDAGSVGLANGVASSAGIALGILAAAILVQLDRESLILPYVLLLVLIALAIAGAWWMPEPVSRRKNFHLSLQRPSIPAAAREPFVLAALTATSSWSIGGLFFSLGPALGAELSTLLTLSYQSLASSSSAGRPLSPNFF